MKEEADIVIRCECGYTWLIDYDPTPDECLDHHWQLGIVKWGSWVDRNGKLVQNKTVESVRLRVEDTKNL